MKKINIKGVSIQTWARTIVLLLALVSQLCMTVGRCNHTIDVAKWQEFAIYFLTVISSLWSWWGNNSFTEKAQQIDKILKGDDKNGNQGS